MKLWLKGCCSCVEIPGFVECAGGPFSGFGGSGGRVFGVVDSGEAGFWFSISLRLGSGLLVCILLLQALQAMVRTLRLSKRVCPPWHTNLSFATVHVAALVPDSTAAVAVAVEDGDVPRTRNPPEAKRLAVVFEKAFLGAERDNRRIHPPVNTSHTDPAGPAEDEFDVEKDLEQTPDSRAMEEKSGLARFQAFAFAETVAYSLCPIWADISCRASWGGLGHSLLKRVLESVLRRQ